MLRHHIQEAAGATGVGPVACPLPTWLDDFHLGVVVGVGARAGAGGVAADQDLRGRQWVGGGCGQTGDCGSQWRHGGNMVERGACAHYTATGKTSTVPALSHSYHVLCTWVFLSKSSEAEDVKARLALAGVPDRRGPGPGFGWSCCSRARILVGGVPAHLSRPVGGRHQRVPAVHVACGLDLQGG